jgi:hypothetical protein
VSGLLDLNFQGQVAQLVERSPEKAGVGGSIPSLATMFSGTYRQPNSQFHSISFQNILVRQTCLHWNDCAWMPVLGRGRWAGPAFIWFVPVLLAGMLA